MTAITYTIIDVVPNEDFHYTEFVFRAEDDVENGDGEVCLIAKVNIAFACLLVEQRLLAQSDGPFYAMLSEIVNCENASDTDALYGAVFQ
jgi:hypothetical protein